MPYRLALAATALAVALASTAGRADAAVTPTIKDRTLLVAGDATSEKLTLRVPPTALKTVELDVGDDGSAEFRFSRGSFDRVRVLAGDGADTVRIDDAPVRGSVPLTATIDGQGGDDTLLGGRGDDTLLGGAGNDAFTAVGNDSADGGAGLDRLAFKGTTGAEEFRLAADGPHARLTRDVGAIALNADAVERLDVATVGGDDRLTVGALAGTGVQEVQADLAGSGTDRVVLDGTSGSDVASILQSGGQAFVLGLDAFVTIRNADPARDELTINGLAGNDRIEAASLTNLKLVENGGDGNDTLEGSPGPDVLVGGEGTDFIEGKRGDDVAQLGAGNDQFFTRAADGSDVVEGQAGTDSVSFSGVAANEKFEASAAGERMRLTRNGALTVDTGGVEALNVLSFGGADVVRVRDLATTAVTRIDANLFDFAVPGGNQDVVQVDGTNGDDNITVTGDGVVEGLRTRINIVGAAAAGDRLEVNGLAGKDTIDSTALSAAKLQFRADAGSGDDFLLGGAGDDVLSGGDGADVIFAGGGDNVAFGGAGDDLLRGEEGDDLLDGGADDDILIGNAGDDILLNGEILLDD